MFSPFLWKTLDLIAMWVHFNMFGLSDEASKRIYGKLKMALSLPLPKFLHASQQDTF